MIWLLSLLFNQALAYRTCSPHMNFCVSAVINGSDFLITMTSNATGWVMFGINSQQTFDESDVIFVWPNNDGSYFTLVDSFWHNSFAPPEPDKSQQLKLVAKTVNLHGSTLSNWTIQFKRPVWPDGVETGEDYPVDTSIPMYWTMGYASASSANPHVKGLPTLGSEVSLAVQSLGEADWKGISKTSLPFTNLAGYNHTGTVVGIEDDPNYINDLINGMPKGTYTTFISAHGIMMFLAWSILFPWAIFVAKYEKVRLQRWWFLIHKALNITGVFFVLFGVLFATKVSPNYTVRSVHQVMGFVIAGTLLLIQIPLGSVLAKGQNPKNTEGPNSSPKVFSWHRFMGLLLVFIAWFQTISGLFTLPAVPSPVILSWFVFIFWNFGVMSTVKWLHRGPTPTDIEFQENTRLGDLNPIKQEDFDDLEF